MSSSSTNPFVVMISLAGRLHGRTMNESLIGSEAIQEFFEHSFGIFLRPAANFDAHAVFWAFEVPSNRGDIDLVSGFELTNPNSSVVVFDVRTTSSVDAESHYKVPGAISDEHVRITRNNRTAFVDIVVENGQFIVKTLKSSWDLGVLDIVVSSQGSIITLLVDGLPLIFWGSNDSRISISEWKNSLEAHKEFSIARMRDILRDQFTSEHAGSVLKSSRFVGATAGAGAASAAGTGSRNMIMIRQVKFITVKKGSSSFSCKLKFRDQVVFESDTVQRPKESFGGTVTYNQPIPCLPASVAELRTHELSCHCKKLTNMFASRDLTASSSVTPIELLKCQHGQDVELTFELNEGAERYGSVTFTFCRLSQTPLLSSTQTLSDPFLNFRVARIAVSELINVERMGGQNDPYVKITRVGSTDEPWLLKFQNEKGANAEWADSNLEFPVGITFMLQRSQLSEGSTPVQFCIEVIDHNDYTEDVLIGSCTVSLPSMLASLKLNESHKVGFQLKNEKRRNDKSGMIEFEFKRASDELSTLVVPSGPVASGLDNPSSLGPPMVVQELITERIVVSVIDDSVLFSGAAAADWINSIMIVLRLLTGGKLNLAPFSVVEQSINSVTFRVDDLAKLGPILNQIQTPGADYLFRVRGKGFKLARMEVVKIDRSRSLINTMVEAMDSGGQLPESVERDALKFHHCVCVNCPEARTTRQPLTAESVQKIVSDFSELLRINNQEVLLSSVQNFQNLCKGLDLADVSPLLSRTLANELRALLNAGDKDQLDAFPSWLQTESNPETQATSLADLAPVRFEERANTLVTLFEQRFSEFNSGTRTFGSTAALLLLHFEIIYLLKFTCSVEDLKDSFEVLKFRVDQNSKLYGPLLSKHLEAVDSLLEGTIDFIALRDSSFTLLHAIRPVDLHQLNWSVEHSRHKAEKTSDDETVILLNSRYRAATKRERARSQEAQAAEADSPQRLNSSDGANESVSRRKTKRKLRIVVSSESDLPSTTSMFYSEMYSVGESCFSLRNAESTKPAEGGYFDRIVHRPGRFGFGKTVHTKADSMFVDLFSAKSSELIERQVQLSRACLIYFLNKVVDDGDNWQQEDIDFIRYKLCELSLVCDLDYVSTLTQKNVSEVNAIIKENASKWLGNVREAMESFERDSSKDTLARVARPLAHLAAFSRLFNTNDALLSVEMGYVGAIRHAHACFTDAIGCILHAQQGLQFDCESFASLKYLALRLRPMLVATTFFSESGLKVAYPNLFQVLLDTVDDDDESIIKQHKGFLTDCLNTLVRTNKLSKLANVYIESKDCSQMVIFHAEITTFQAAVESMANSFAQLKDFRDHVDEASKTYLAKFRKHVSDIVGKNISQCLAPNVLTVSSVGDGCDVVKFSMEHLQAAFGNDYSRSAVIDAEISELLEKLQTAIVQACHRCADVLSHCTDGDTWREKLAEIGILDKVFGNLKVVCSKPHQEQIEKYYNDVLDRVDKLVADWANELENIFKAVVVSKNLPAVTEQASFILRGITGFHGAVSYRPKLLSLIGRLHSRLSVWCGELVRDSTAAVEKKLSVETGVEVDFISSVWKRSYLLWGVKAYLGTTDKEQFEAACNAFQETALKLLANEQSPTPEGARRASIYSYICGQVWTKPTMDRKQLDVAPARLTGFYGGKFEAWKQGVELQCSTVDGSNSDAVNQMTRHLLKCFRDAKVYSDEKPKFELEKEKFSGDVNLKWCGLDDVVFDQLPRQLGSVVWTAYVSKLTEFLRGHQDKLIACFPANGHDNAVITKYVGTLSADATPQNHSIRDLLKAEQIFRSLADVGLNIVTSLGSEQDLEFIRTISAFCDHLKVQSNGMIDQVPKDITNAWSTGQFSTIVSVLDKARTEGDKVYNDGLECLAELVNALISKLNSLVPPRLLDSVEVTAQDFVELRDPLEKALIVRSSINPQYIGNVWAPLESATKNAETHWSILLQSLVNGFKSLISSQKLSAASQFLDKIQEIQAPQGTLNVQLVQEQGNCVLLFNSRSDEVNSRYRSCADKVQSSGTFAELQQLLNTEYFFILEKRGAMESFLQVFIHSLKTALETISTDCSRGLVDVELCEGAFTYLSTLLPLLPKAVEDRTKGFFEACSTTIQTETARVLDIKSRIEGVLNEVEMELGGSLSLSIVLEKIRSNWIQWEPFASTKQFTNKLDCKIKDRVEAVLVSVQSRLQDVADQIEQNDEPTFQISIVEGHLDVLAQIKVFSESSLGDKLSELCSRPKFVASILASAEDALVSTFVKLFYEVKRSVASLNVDEKQDKQEQAKIDITVADDLCRFIGTTSKLEALLSLPAMDSLFSEIRLKCASKVGEASYIPVELSLVGAIQHWVTFGKSVLEQPDMFTDNQYNQYVRSLHRHVHLLDRFANFTHQTVVDAATSSLREIHSAVVSKLIGCYNKIKHQFSDEEAPALAARIASERTHEEMVREDEKFKYLSRQVFVLHTVVKEFDGSILWAIQPCVLEDGFDFSSVTNLSKIEDMLRKFLRHCEATIAHYVHNGDTDFIGKSARIILDLWFLGRSCLSLFESTIRASVINAVDLVKLGSARTPGNKANRLSELYTVLNPTVEIAGPRSGFGPSLVFSLSVFKPFTLAQENAERNRTSVDELLANLKFVMIDKSKDARVFDAKKEVYRRHLEEFQVEYNKLVTSADDKEIISSVQSAVYNAIFSLRPDEDYFALARFLIARVFAMWTLLYNKSKSQEFDWFDEQAEILAKVEPNRGQVLSLLILFESLRVRLDERGFVSAQVENQFVQIGTGEGKSVTSAVAACVFALIGMSVDCTCYSAQLCSRDAAEFQDLFNAFDVQRFISYQTFNKQCEKFVTQRLQCFGGVTATVEQIIGTGQAPTAVESVSPARPVTPRGVSTPGLLGMGYGWQRVKAARRILLQRAGVKTTKRDMLGDVAKEARMFKDFMSTRHAQAAFDRNVVLFLDEADMFYSESFCGELLPIVANVPNVQFAKVLQLLWKEQQQYRTLRDVVGSSEIAALLNDGFLDCWNGLLRNTLAAVLADRDTVISGNSCADYQCREVVGKGLKICYKGQDGAFTDSISMNYETSFVYLKEAGARNLGEHEILQSPHLALQLKVGEFSFSEIPKKYLARGCMIGVSGTLEQMLDTQKQFLYENYDLKHFAVMPCCYGIDKKSRFNFLKPNSSLPDVRIVREAEHFAAISDEIIARLKDDVRGRNSEFVRSVIVIFATNEALKAFEKSQVPVLRAKGCTPDMVHVLNSYTAESDVPKTIWDACEPRNVTLCSREYGRGIDFNCRNVNLRNAGGMHVISTFLSEDISEEVQIQGRTARKTNPGSFSLVLSDAGLFEVLACTSLPADLSTQLSSEATYRKLNDLRNHKYHEVCSRRFGKLPAARESDVKAQKFIDDILTPEKIDDVIRTLTENASPYENGEDVLAAAGAGAGSGSSSAGPRAESRTIFLIDATGSMTTSMDCVKQSLRFMLDYLKEVCGSSAKFTMQVIVYRNYGDGPQKLVVASKPSEDATYLMQFIEESGKCMGGGRFITEAIEAGLQYINNNIAAFEPTQIILMGDAGYNSNVSIRQLRKDWVDAVHSRNAWDLWPETNYDTERNRLLDHCIHDRAADNNKIKLHTFYVHKKVNEQFKKCFKDIATAFNSSAFTLDLHNTGDTMNDYLREAGKVIIKDVAASAAESEQLAENFERAMRKRPPNFVAGSK